MAAAVGSLMIRSTLRPAMAPASFVAYKRGDIVSLVTLSICGAALASTEPYEEFLLTHIDLSTTITVTMVK